MKTIFLCSIRPHLIIGIIGVLLTACREEDTAVTPAVQFSIDLKSVSEGEAIKVYLTLDKPATKNSLIEISLETNAVYERDYRLDKEVDGGILFLDIPKGEQRLEFEVTTFNDEKYEGTRFILFQLRSVTPSLRFGTRTALTLTIADDEVASTANFSAPSATLYENADDGILVEIPFSTPAKGEGSIAIRLNAGEAIPQINFRIDQELANDSFSLNVVENQGHARFRVYPIDNDLFTGNFVISFFISETSGVIRKGPVSGYTVTLIDDELPSIVTFAVTSGVLQESNVGGIIVGFQLSSPLKGEGQIEVALADGNSLYGSRFTTMPVLQDNTIRLDLANGQMSASFSVFPVNNDEFDGDVSCSFLISKVSGVVWKGSTNFAYQLSIVDDDVP